MESRLAQLPAIPKAKRHTGEVWRIVFVAHVLVFGLSLARGRAASTFVDLMELVVLFKCFDRRIFNAAADSTKGLNNFLIGDHSLVWQFSILRGGSQETTAATDLDLRPMLLVGGVGGGSAVVALGRSVLA